MLGSSQSPAFDRWSRQDASSFWVKPVEESQRVYVGQLPRMEPQSAVDKAMQEFFSLASLEPTAVSKIISPHQSKKDMPGDHYYLFVDLPKAEDVDLAVQMLDGIEPSWGGKVRVRRAKVNQDRKVMREQFGDKASEDDANKG